MSKHLINALAIALLFVTPVLAADPTGVFSGQASDGPVVLQLQPGQPGYLKGRLHCNGRDFVVVARQNGDHLLGLVGARGIPSVQFLASLQPDGSIILMCDNTSIALSRNQPAGAPADAGNPAMTSYAAQANAASNAADAEQQAMRGASADIASQQRAVMPADPVTADLSAMADQAASERQAEMAKLYAPQNPQQMAQPNSMQTEPSQNPYAAYPTSPAAGGQGYYGAYQAAGTTASSGSYQVPQPQSYSAAPAYAYPTPYTPMPSQEPAASYNQPNDGSAVMQNYEQYQAAQDQMSLQRSDTMREQNRSVGPDGEQITSPLDATQVTVDQANQAWYTTEQAPTPPADQTVAQPYSYSAPEAPAAEAPAAEGDGN